MRVDRDAGLQGHYAGIATRSAAFVFDLLAIALSFALGAQAFDYLVSAVFNTEFTLKETTVVPDVLLAVWAFAYFAYSFATSGRTPGMAMVGVKVVHANGRPLGVGYALLRTAALALSVALLLISVLLLLLRRDRRTIHDLIASTAVVYSWDARSARLRQLAKQASGVPG